ncbi:phosphate ABC transporter substrate-binding protein [Aquabacterium sp.]|uniref:phosphate ABC transporter substrate-binding protein n=1 Tax=Aquabacterium sp. TaxID=1872578 RepID=UPI004037A20F
MNMLNSALAGAVLSLAVTQLHAQLVVIVSAKNANTAMTTSNADKVFLGKVKLFPDSTPAIPMDLPKGDERAAFYDKVSGKSPAQLKAYWAKVVFTGEGAPPKEVDSPEAMVKLVAQNPNTVGYVDKSFVDKSVKVLLEVK